MRILHLGFEDPRRPGAGGGSLRNVEVNRRLAQRHRIEVVCAAFPGCEERVEDGVHYRHVGTRGGSRAGLLSYFAAVPAVVARHGHNAELVVEDFAGPWASMGVGHWTRQPTVGIVQWFFPEAKAREYHLPVGLTVAMSRWGANSHRELIAMSEDLAAELRGVAPRATVTVASLGIDTAAVRAALTPPPERESGLLVYLGRLDIVQKGLDTLLATLAALRRDGRTVRLVLAGDGHEERLVRELIARHDLERAVELPGRVEGDAKWQLLARAELVVMPSRYETFGYVALEAMAAGTPVVAFGIPGLRGTLSADAGVLVADRDEDAFTDAVRALLDDPTRRTRLGAAGRRIAEATGWDTVAQIQEDVYERAAARAH